MDSIVDVNVEKLIAFRSHLVRFNDTLHSEFKDMRSHFKNLGDTWHDAQYDKFEKDLDDVSRGIEHYLQAADGHEDHLARLIQKLDDVLRT